MVSSYFIITTVRFKVTDQSRSVLHTFITAARTLLANTISNPAVASARDDLTLLEPLLTLLRILASDGLNDKLEGMYESFMGLYENAKIAVDLYAPERGRLEHYAEAEQAGNRESVEDFLRRMENISSGYETSNSLVFEEAAFGKFAY